MATFAPVVKIISEKINYRSRRTLLVLVLTLVAAVAQVYFGNTLNIYSLEQNGWHFSAHVLVLGLGLVAYVLYKKDKSIRILNLVGLIIAIIIIVSSLNTLFISLKNIFTENYNNQQDYMLALKIISLSFTIHLCSVLILGKQKAIADTNYKALYLHVFADLITTFAAFISIILAYKWHVYAADSYAGILSALIVLAWAGKLAKNAYKKIIA